jgi:hypothetical protein
MMIIKYENESDVQPIVEQKKSEGLYLKQVMNIVDGNFLVFEKKEPTFAEQLAENDAKIKTLEAQQQQTNEDLSALMDFVITGGM